MESYLFNSMKEPIEHGTILTPYRCFSYVNQSGDPDILLHWHEEAEIDFIHNGSAEYQAGSEVFEGQPGDIMFFAPGTLHAVRSLPGRSVETDVLIFHPDMLGANGKDQCALSFLRPLIKGTKKPIACIHPGDEGYSALSACLKELFTSQYEQTPYSELKLREKLFLFLCLLYENGYIKDVTENRTALHYTDQVKTALNYIQNHYQEQITIEQLANLCHFSKPYFMSFFRQAVGLSCMEYILQLRLKLAENLLRTTDRPVAEIALECGYRNLSNFNRQFKDYYHTTPREYRKVQKQDI